MTRTIAYLYQRPIVTRVDLASAHIHLERQKQQMQSHAAWFQLTVCDTIIESSLSTSTLERHGLQLALRRMEEIGARSLLINSLNDLSSCGSDLQSLLDSYFTKGFILFCGSERIRSDTVDGRAYLETKAGDRD